jgi:hypothetical protein
MFPPVASTGARSLRILAVSAFAAIGRVRSLDLCELDPEMPVEILQEMRRRVHAQAIDQPLPARHRAR